MRWFWPSLLLWPVSLFADPVTIRSGEHDTFSRLVIAIGEGTDWKVEQTETGYELELTGRADGFDMSEVFDRIPRDRIADLSQPASNRLALAVNCTCFADAFLWRPGQLVLDIADGEDPNSPIERPVARSDDAQTTPDAPTEMAVVLPNLFTDPQQSDPIDAPLSPDLAGAATRDEDIQRTETALIEGLARAASQGFLDAAVSEPVNLEEPMEIEDAPTEMAQDTPAIVMPQQPGVGITSAMDRDLAVLRDALNSNLGPQCLPADLFEISDWASEDAFHTQVAALAEDLAGEFGREPLAAQNQLARLYLHFGFGAEARVVLSADSTQSQTRQVLVQLAGLIDEYDGPFPLIEAQAKCETPAALWAFISAPDFIDDKQRTNILREFYGLPKPLRGQIAPRLARQFMSINDTDAAEQLLSATQNTDVAGSHDVQSTRALLAEERDDPAEAISVLTEEASDNARTTPESLIRLIRLNLDNEIVPQESDLLLAGAMRQEFRDSPIAAQLKAVEAEGWAYLANYQVAIDLLRGTEGEDALRATNTVFTKVTQKATPTEFLGFVFDEMPDGLSAATQNAIAQRLIEIGFPDRAQVFLTGPATRDAAAERRYLRAQAALGTQNFALAIDALLGLTDARARTLRSQAYEGMGAHREALSALNPGNDSGGDAALQFRAGAWEQLRTQEDDVLSAFAQTVLTPPTQDAVESLADRREILAQSEQSRRAVEGLLQRFNGATGQE